MLRYRQYLVPEEVDWKDAVPYVYGGSVECQVQSKCEALRGDVNQLCTSYKKDGADDTVSRNAISIEMTKLWDENIAMDVWQDYSTDASVEKY